MGPVSDGERFASTGAATIVDALSVAEENRRVLIIANHLMIAQAVVIALTQLKFSARVAVPTPAGRIDEIATWRPGVVLLDVDSMGTGAILSCIRDLSEARIPITVLTSDPDALPGGEAFRAWAISVVDKASSLSQLFKVMSRVLDGHEVITERDHKRLSQRRARLAPFEILTYREKFVLSRIMDGLRADAIAMESCVSLSTVRSQIKAILQKLGVNSQLAAASMARQAGWMFTPSQAGVSSHVS